MEQIKDYIFEKLRINKNTNISSHDLSNDEVDKLIDSLGDKLEKSQYKKYIVLIKLDKDTTSIIIDLNPGSFSKSDAMAICGFLRYSIVEELKLSGCTGDTIYFNPDTADIIIDYSRLKK